MGPNRSFRTIGVYVPDDVHMTVEAHLRDSAGMATSLDDYFDSKSTTVARGDPVAEILNVFSQQIVDEFEMLYDVADFSVAQQVECDGFQILTLPMMPRASVELRELFRAACTITGRETRVVQTAILRSALDKWSLPDLNLERKTRK